MRIAKTETMQRSILRKFVWLCCSIFAFFNISSAVAEPFVDSVFPPLSLRFGAAEQTRFIECDKHKSRVPELVCLVGAAAYSMSSGLYFYELNHKKDPITQNKPKTHYFAAFAAIEAMTMVQTLQSAARYSFISIVEKKALGSLSMEECLANWVGICGNHIDLFLHIMRALDIPARTLQFTYDLTHNNVTRRNTHIVAEVYYSGKWRFFDVSNGAVYPTDTPLLFKSYDEIKRDLSAKPLLNENNGWFAFRKMVGVNDMDYLKLKHSGVISDMSGQITIDVKSSTKHPEAVERFEDLFNFIGDNQINQKREGISYRFNLKGKHKAKLEMGGVGCVDHPGNRISVAGREFPVSMPVIEIDVEKSFDLKVKHADDVCYVVVNQITFTRQGAQARLLPTMENASEEKQTRNGKSNP